MYAQELLVHNCGKGQGAKRFHTGFVDLLGILMFAFKFEGKIVRQVPALMISSQQPQSVRVPNLAGPQVQDALIASAI